MEDYVVWHYGRLYPFSGISYEKMVQKKDPVNGTQCAIVPWKVFSNKIRSNNGRYKEQGNMKEKKL